MTTTGWAQYFEMTIERDTMSATGEPCYVAKDSTMPGAIGYGDTEDEAAEMLTRSREAMLRQLASRREPPPVRLANSESDLVLTGGSF